MYLSLEGKRMKGILDKLEKSVIVAAEDGYIYYGNKMILNKLNRDEIKGKYIGEFLDGIEEAQADKTKYFTYFHNDHLKKQYVEVEVLEDDWKGKKAYFYLLEDKPRNLLEQVLDQLPISIWIEDSDRRYCYANEFFLKKLNIPSGESYKIIGKLSEELFEKEMADALSQGEEKAFEAKQPIIYEKEISRNGCLQHYYFQMIPLRLGKNNAGYIVGIKYNMTMQKNQVKEREAYKQKVEAERIRNDFFANISHEFRTPINIILASLQLLENNKDKAQETIEKYTGKIKQNAFRLLKLSNNVIDLTKMDVGSEILHLENHNMISIIEEVTLSVVGYAENNGIDIIFDTEVEELVMACDIEKIERVMLNLLSNAVKFTPRGGQIKVNVALKGQKLAIMVSDTGIGIPKEKCETIFDRFIQVDTSLRRRCEGSGMGLAIVKSIVDMHQGTISASSIIGQGTLFTVELPVYVQQEKHIKSYSMRENEDKAKRCSIEFSDVYSY